MKLSWSETKAGANRQRQKDCASPAGKDERCVEKHPGPSESSVERNHPG